MADRYDLETHIKLTSDTKAGEKARDVIKDVGDEAKKSASKAESAGKRSGSAFTSLGTCIQKATRAIGFLNAAIAGFGAIEVVRKLVSVYQLVHEWITRSKKEAEELNRKIQDAKNAEAIESARSSYERLNKAISETMRLEQERDRLAAQKKDAKRAAEDAELDLAEEKEISGLNANDPDRAQRETLIRNRYARSRSKMRRDRASMDLVARQQKLNDEALSDDENADRIEKEMEKGGDVAGSLRRQIALEKDPERKKALDAQLDKVISEGKKKQSEVKRYRESAQSKRAEMSNLMGSDRAEYIRDRAENVRLNRSDADARLQIEKNAENRKKKADEERKKKEKEQREEDEVMRARSLVSSAPYMARKFEDEKARLNSRLLAAASRRDKEAEDARLAEEALKSFDAANASRPNATGVQARRARLEETARREAAEARAAETEFRRTESAVSKVLSMLADRIKKFNSDLQKSESRIKSASENGKG